MSLECWPSPWLALPSYPTMHCPGPQAKKPRVFLGGPFLCRWGANGPFPQPKAPPYPHAPSMSSCGRNATCFIGERSALGKGGRQSRWKASPCPPPITPFVLCGPCCPHFSPLVTLPLTMHSISNLKWRCCLPQGHDSLPRCLLSSSWQASRGQRQWEKQSPSGIPLLFGHNPGQAQKEVYSQGGPRM